MEEVEEWKKRPSEARCALSALCLSWYSIVNIVPLVPGGSDTGGRSPTKGHPLGKVPPPADVAGTCKTAASLYYVVLCK